MSYEFTLKRPASLEGQPYDEYARSVIKALLVRLSIMKHVVKESISAFVCGLSPTGDIMIRVAAIGIITDTSPAESTKQRFLLSIHRALVSAESELKNSNLEV
jgi:hypothetical protein